MTSLKRRFAMLSVALAAFALAGTSGLCAEDDSSVDSQKVAVRKEATQSTTQAATGGSRLLRFKEDGLYGYKDDYGKVVISPRFHYAAARFSEGMAWVKIEGEGKPKFGYIDSAGKMAIQPQRWHPSDFSEGLAVVTLFGHLDDKGEFQRGTGSTHRHGFINKSGKMVIPARFLHGDKFCDGLARAGSLLPIKDGYRSRTGYIDKTGKWAIKPQFPDCGNFYKGLAPAAVGDDPNQLKWGFIDKTGRFAIPPKYLWAVEFSIILDGRGQVGIDANHWGYIDRSGKILEQYGGPHPMPGN